MQQPRNRHPVAPNRTKQKLKNAVAFFPKTSQYSSTVNCRHIAFDILPSLISTSLHSFNSLTILNVGSHLAAILRIATKRIRDFHGLCLSGAYNVPTVRYIEVPGTSTGHRHHKHQGDIEGQDLEIGAVDKLLVGELGEGRVQHGDGHQD